MRFPDIVCKLASAAWAVDVVSDAVSANARVVRALHIGLSREPTRESEPTRERSDAMSPEIAEKNRQRRISLFTARPPHDYTHSPNPVW